MILDDIVAEKVREVDAARRRVPLSVLEGRVATSGPLRPFAAALRQPGTVRIIAELKKASPSAGVIRPSFDPAGIARDYESHGAAALSVLTDRSYFQGDMAHLEAARRATRLPVLRKDFVMDPYQVFEARAAPADCVLLIVRILAPDRLRELIRLAASLGMDALVETHAEGEVRSALDAGASLLGINNRDLDTLRVDLGTTHRLIRHVPPGITVVSESGIRTPEDIAALRSSGAHAALVGESLLRHPSPGERLSLLVRA